MLNSNSLQARYAEAQAAECDDVDEEKEIERGMGQNCYICSPIQNGNFPWEIRTGYTDSLDQLVAI
jgi:hypothetical protein